MFFLAIFDHNVELILYPFNRHWLHHVQRRENVRLQNATTRLSICNPGHLNETTHSAPNTAMYIVRRAEGSPALSISTESTETSNVITLEPTSIDLSTALISPRPLGPTHILIAHAVPSQPIVKGATVRRQRVPSIHTETLEMPINDLLFLLNVPNISYEYSLALHGTVLPRRKMDELPHVSMSVPQLKTFPEIVVYLHTKNQAALFRALIPEWARDIMYPLPPPPSPNISLGDADEYAPSSLCCARSPSIPNIRRLFKSGVFAGQKKWAKSEITGPLAFQKNMDRSVNTIGIELVEAAGRQPSVTGVDDILSEIVETLDALSDNLSYIGYFNKSLWNELNVYRSIVLYAISYQARIPLEDEA